MDYKVLNDSLTASSSQLKSVLEEKQQLEEDIINMQSEESRLKDSLNQAQFSCNRLESDNKRLVETAESTDLELRKVLEQTHQLKEEISALKSSSQSKHLIDELQFRCDKLEVEKQVLVETSEKSVSEFQLVLAQKEVLESEISQIRSQEVVTKESLLQLTKEYGRLESQFKELQHNSEAMDCELKRCLETNKQLENELALYKSEDSSMKGAFQEVKENFEKLNSDHKTLTSQFEILSNELKASKIQNDDLQREIAKIKSEDVLLRDSLKLAKSDYGKLETELKSLKADFELASSSLRISVEEKERLETEMLTVKSEKDSIFDSFQQVKFSCDRLESENKRLSELSEVVDSELKKALESNHLLQEEIRLIKSNKSHLQPPFNVLQEKYRSLEMEFKELTGSSEATRNELNTVLQAKDDLHNEVTKLKNKEELSHIELLKLQSQIDSFADLRVQLTDTNEKLEASLKENELLKTEIATLQESAKNIHIELENARDKLSQQNKLSLGSNLTNESLKTENNLLVQEVANLKSNASSKQDEIKNLLMTIQELTEKEKHLSTLVSELEAKQKTCNNDDLMNNSQECRELRKQVHKLKETVNQLLRENRQHIGIKQEYQDLEIRFLAIKEQHEKNKARIDNYNSLAVELREAKSQLASKKEELHICSTKCSVLLAEKQELMTDNNLLRSTIAAHSTKNEFLSEIIRLLKIPSNCSQEETLKSLKEKIGELDTLSSDLEDEKLKSQQLDQECNTLNDEIEARDRQIVDIYRIHNNEMEQLKKKMEALEQQKAGIEATSMKEGEVFSSSFKTSVCNQLNISLSCSDDEIIKYVKSKVEKLEEKELECVSLENRICCMMSTHSTEKDMLSSQIKEEEVKIVNLESHNNRLANAINYLEARLLELQNLKQSRKDMDVTECCTQTNNENVQECKACAESAKAIQALKLDVVEKGSQITSLQLQIDTNSIPYRKKAQLAEEYKKKVQELKDELRDVVLRKQCKMCGTCFTKSVVEASSQTESDTTSAKIELGGTSSSGIVMAHKVKELEEQVAKYMKKYTILKQVYQKRSGKMKTLEDQIKVLSSNENQPHSPEMPPSERKASLRSSKRLSGENLPPAKVSKRDSH